MSVVLGSKADTDNEVTSSSRWVSNFISFESLGTNCMIGIDNNDDDVENDKVTIKGAPTHWANSVILLTCKVTHRHFVVIRTIVCRRKYA